MLTVALFGVASAAHAEGKGQKVVLEGFQGNVILVRTQEHIAKSLTESRKLERPPAQARIRECEIKKFQSTLQCLLLLDVVAFFLPVNDPAYLAPDVCELFSYAQCHPASRG